MPINTASPLEAFTMGQDIGRANSPITGIGTAIQNIVDDARKKGLLKAQSQYQTEGSNQLDILKTEREEANLLKPKETIFAGATAEQDRTITAPRGTDVKALPQEDSTSALLASIFGGGASIGTPNKKEVVTNDELSVKAAKFLEDNGQSATPANIQTAIDQGWVQ